MQIYQRCLSGKGKPRSEGSTKRKEILAKFLDLDIFDKKFKLAKEDSADIKGALNKLKDHDFIGELAEAKSHLTYSEIELDRKKQQVENLKDRAKSLKETMEEISGKLDSSQQELLSIKDITRELQLVESKISSIKKSNYDLEESVQNDEQVLVKIEEHLQKIDIDSYEEKLQEIDVKLRELSSLEKEIELLEQKETTETNKVKLLSEVTCRS